MTATTKQFMNCSKNSNYLFLLLLVLNFIALPSFSQETSVSLDGSDDLNLLNSYIDSRGYDQPIVFDSKNIKMFWTHNSVFGKDGDIHIILNSSKKKWISNPYEIMLSNVNETMSCKIDVITRCNDLSFSIVDSNSNILASSSNRETFLEYNIISSELPLELTRIWNGNKKDYSFNLEFQSNSLETVTIKKIVLSFSKNTNRTFLVSPGNLIVSKEMIADSKDYTVENDMSISGKNCIITLTKNIVVSDRPAETKATFKNVGQGDVRVLLGHHIYSKEGKLINSIAFPYKNKNKVLTVISAKEGTTDIVVDAFAEWEKNCYLALNVEEDLSDLPNFNILGSKVADYIQTKDNQYIIKLDKPLKQDLEKGTKIRVHGVGGKYLFKGDNKIIKPGEEISLTLSLTLNNKSTEYTTNSFPKGTFFVKPAILFRAVDSTKENKISIQNYTIDY